MAEIALFSIAPTCDEAEPTAARGQ